MVMGCVPVSCACCAIRADGSTAIELGRGSSEVRFEGAVEVRRGSREDIACGCLVAQRCRCGLGEGGVVVFSRLQHVRTSVISRVYVCLGILVVLEVTRRTRRDTS